jgi:hypothetical protein
LDKNHEDEILKLNGINTNINPVQSMGYSFLNLHFNSVTYTHKFHILIHETNIPLDGILGNDFLSKTKARIDYGSNHLLFRNMKIPLYFRYEINQNQPKSLEKSTSFIIQPRTEISIEFDVQNPEIKQGITPDVQILNGVYLCKSITNVISDNRALTTILNTTDKPIRIS